MKLIKGILNKYNNLSLPAKASWWFLFCSIVQKCISIITTPIFTRLMSTEQYGIVSLYNSWLAMLSIFMTLDLYTGGYNKAMIKFKDDRDGYTTSILFLSSLIIGFWAFLYFIFHNQFNIILGLSTPIIVMMILYIAFSNSMSLWMSRRRFEFKYKGMVILTLISAVISSTIGVIFVLSTVDYKAEARILSLVLVTICCGLFCLVNIVNKSKKILSRPYWKFALRYNIPLIPHYLSQQILNQSDRVMINNICGASYAGIYSVAYQIAVAMNLVTNAIFSAFSPWAFQEFSKGNYRSVGRLSTRIVVGMSALCFLFSLMAPEIIFVLGGTKYYSAIWIVPPVAMSLVFNMLYSLISTIAMYYEKTVYIMFGSIAAALANVCLNAIFIPIYGFVAAGYTTLFCFIIYSLAHYIIMCFICRKNNIDQPFNSKIIFATAFMSTGLSVFASFLYNYTYVRYAFILLLILVSVALFRLSRRCW